MDGSGVYLQDALAVVKQGEGVVAEYVDVKRYFYRDAGVAA